MTAQLKYDRNEDCLVEVVRAKGTYMSKMGLTKSGKRMLLPEEALFLVENKLAVVKHGAMTLGIPHVYRILFCEAGFPSFCYAAFSHMIRAGYVLRRRSASSPEIELNVARCSYDVYTKIPTPWVPDYVLLVMNEIHAADACEMEKLRQVERSLNAGSKLLIANGDAANVRISRFVTDAKIDSLNLNTYQKNESHQTKTARIP